MSLAAHLIGLNDAQARAVTHGVEAGQPLRPATPLLVIAGAGTGKTKTLAHRVAHLLLNGADPRRILLLTFSRRAAETMIRRVKAICAEALAQKGALADGLIWSGTFHGIASRLLRLYAQRVGLDEGFTILDRADSADLIDIVRDELGFSHTEKRFPRKATCLAIHSYAVNAAMPLEGVLVRQFPWCGEWVTELRQLFRGYAEAKHRQSVLDYDDLLLAWDRLLAVPELAAEMGAMFDHVLVDEVQDTNRLQGSILRHLKPDGLGLTVVGDDAQAIYGFRAASVRTILDFPDWFRPRARIVALEQNYRSTGAILEASNAVIGQAKEGFRKRLWSDRMPGGKPQLVTVADEADQAQYVADRILAAREEGLRLADQAVLFRSASHSAQLEIQLIRRNIPFVKFGGLKFLEAAHVKDVLAILRLAENPKDRVAGFRVLQMLPGIGPGTARKLLDTAAGTGITALAHARPPAAALPLWQQLLGLYGEIVPAAWAGQIERVRLYYDPLLPELHEHPAPRLKDLDQLEAMAPRHGSRGRFLADLTLDPPDAASDESGVPHKDEDTLTLSTIHSAKGLEWRAVHLLNVVDGCMPVDLATGTEAEIEEERRVLYVAMTRAKDELHLVMPERFYVGHQARDGQRHVRAARTRFISAPILPAFEQRQGSRPMPAEPSKPAAGPKVDLAAMLKGVWD